MKQGGPGKRSAGKHNQWLLSDVPTLRSGTPQRQALCTLMTWMRHYAHKSVKRIHTCARNSRH